MLAAAVAAGESKQALDLRILELDPAESGLTDYFLVMSGTNPRQIQSLADEIDLQIKKQFGQDPNSREGYRQAEWILLDYVDFVVHIFSQEKRAFYHIERLRKSAQTLTADQLQAALLEKTARARTASKKSAKKNGKVAAGKSAKKTASARKAPGVKKPAAKKRSARPPARSKPKKKA